MSAAGLLERPDLDDLFDDADFVLDLRVVESTTGIADAPCDSSDGCGNTCETSACTSVSNEPA